MHVARTRREMLAKFWLKPVKVRDHSEDADAGGINIKMDFEKLCVRVWTRFIWLTKNAGSGLL
jgi:hypothetical protein